MGDSGYSPYTSNRSLGVAGLLHVSVALLGAVEARNPLRRYSRLKPLLQFHCLINNYGDVVIIIKTLRPFLLVPRRVRGRVAGCVRPLQRLPAAAGHPICRRR